jgi:hypothetical protein
VLTSKGDVENRDKTQTKNPKTAEKIMNRD